MLSEADPPPNYQLLFISSNKIIIQKKETQEIFFVLRGTCMCSGMGLFLFSCSTLRTKEAM